MTTHSLEGLKLERLMMPSVGEDVEPLELSHVTGGDANWHSRDRKQFGDF